MDFRVRLLEGEDSESDAGSGEGVEDVETIVLLDRTLCCVAAELGIKSQGTTSSSTQSSMNSLCCSFGSTRVEQSDATDDSEAADAARRKGATGLAPILSALDSSGREDSVGLLC